MKKILTVFAVVFAVAILFGCQKQIIKNVKQSNHTAIYNDSTDLCKNPLFNEVLGHIRNKYVEKNINNKKMLEGAINGMLQSLDPYTIYLGPEETQLYKTRLTNEFYGIGTSVEKEGNEIIIISVIEKSPADKAGLKAGDSVIKVKDDNGETLTKNLTLTSFVLKVRGEKGTKVVLTIYREGIPDLLEIEIIRDKIEIPGVTIKKFDDVGYIKLHSFNLKTPWEVADAMENFKKERIAKLIIDVRDNSGGLMDAVIDVASLFLPNDEPIMQIVGRDTSTIELIFSSLIGTPSNIPLTILVNERSASASEILAAAIKENKRGKIIGKKTFGKGSVQRVIPLSDGGEIHITIARFYSPDRNAIYGVGVEPDIQVFITDPLNFELGNPEKDPQLKKAIESMR